jgi:hypothetical protein
MDKHENPICLLPENIQVAALAMHSNQQTIKKRSLGVLPVFLN